MSSKVATAESFLKTDGFFANGLSLTKGGVCLCPATENIRRAMASIADIIALTFANSGADMSETIHLKLELTVKEEEARHFFFAAIAGDQDKRDGFYSAIPSSMIDKRTAPVIATALSAAHRSYKTYLSVENIELHYHTHFGAFSNHERLELEARVRAIGSAQ